MATAIADGEGLIGDVGRSRSPATRRCARSPSRCATRPHAEQLAGSLGALEGVTVIWFHDRAFIAHDGGKLEVASRREIQPNQDVRDVYTPGVARVCTAIAEHPELAPRFTMIGRTVAICTNGTRVLGLGDIGPVATHAGHGGQGALLRAARRAFSALPILIDTKDVDEFVETVVRIAPGVRRHPPRGHLRAGVLRDRAAADRALHQPVMHDDVHGTAVVTLAAAIAACRAVGLRLDQAVVGQIGLGAAGYGIATLIHDAGVERVLGVRPEPGGARARGRARDRDRRRSRTSWRRPTSSSPRAAGRA